MGIFSRMNRVIKSNLNSLVDKAEDPEKLIGQTIMDMESEVKRAKKDSGRHPRDRQATGQEGQGARGGSLRVGAQGDPRGARR